MGIKILLVTGNYLPGRSGGIENYTHWLAGILQQHHFEVEIAALKLVERKDYVYEGIKVNYLNNSLSVLESLIKDGDFDICHFHEYSEYGGIEIPWFAMAKEYCKKVYFTFHLPYLTCYKGDFRYMGIRDCNNFSSMARCVECVFATKLGYKDTSRFDIYNTGIKMLTRLIKKSGRIKLVQTKFQSKKNALEELIKTCDTIFIYGAWFKRILNENGYHSPTLREIPHITKMTSEVSKVNDWSLKKKILFVGRIEEVKGLHLLCNAMALIPEAAIALDVFGNIVDESYYKSCKENFNFNYRGAVPRVELLNKYREYDFLILPSAFTEMYSLALREAFDEGLPVIVSAAKGNKDVVDEGMNGFIFEYDNYKDLANVIVKAYKLKEEGWKPVFKTTNLPEQDIEEIISYYR
ncbi:glycosyltransferase family 4 protein [Ginsengibacter hankyongi]|uniref:Glycosyltransferase family 4 protein n=1 Tax=Ginsengibacter hankyongi TaxID=2607284 RepID=A0A5J5IEA7_9BACT|nr:glycosyltransferase [Ginsengibacter hankyongi]KAA9036399.1 glycosyltransferase family 4 protein [Ginsengibacter hankyongi]